MRRRSCLVLMCAILPGLAQADVFDYVAAPDASYAWKETASGIPGVTNLALTSQTWQGRPWQHTLSVVRPARPTHPDLAVVLITGGSFDPGDATMVNLGVLLANSLGVTFAVLWDIPNQPLWGMREDDLIAHTLGQALATGDQSWPLLFPMTKSAVRAMDALTEWSQQFDTPIKRFITTGASKRGWTTWFTGVVDPRVVAIMPMVYDNLNLAAQMPHQMELWGHYSPQIDDYTRRGLQAVLESEAGRRLGAQIDPYTYRDKLTMPKLLICGANDAYWTIDALNYYRDDLPGATYQVFVPNAGHGLGDLSRVLAACRGFVRLIAAGTPLPKLGWEYAGNGQVALKIDCPTATKASLWSATGSHGLFTDSTWTELPMAGGPAGWTASVPLQAGKDLACFGEVTVEVEGQAMPLSTTIRLVTAR